jgi:amino acid adenylation domain-containing protein
MKAGCAYVALDPTAPDERSKFIVKDSMARMILSAGLPAKKLQAYMEKDIISLDAPRILANFSYEPPRLSREIKPQDVSYCLYTSGTTGTPKGCLITHDNAVQFMLAFSRIFAGHWTEDSKYLQFASFHFDVSVMEQFWSWSIGICVASAPRDLIFEDIPEAIRTLGITNIDLTPSLARLVHPNDVPTLCKGAFITGGEQLKQEILDVWGEHSCIYNGYGPTEATIGCTMYPRVPKNGKPANIGSAYVNVGTFVLKPGTELPVLRGGIGELCVSGKLVGKGYLNREDLTMERFPILKAFNKRVYRTGDLVRILHNGTFIFLGRADDQIKLRGQRLELSEINQVIKKSMSDIQEVVTLVLKHTAQQKEQLITFFVRSSGVDGEDGSVISTMREACKAKLPGYMIPTHFIPLKAIPLNANNKADSKQLAVKYNEISVDYLQKLSQSGQDDREWNENEKSIVTAIAKALSVENESLARTSNIFELGLDSISIIGFSRALQGSGQGNAKLSIVKSNPSIGALVRALLDHDNSDPGLENAFVAASQSMAAFSQRQVVGVCKELGIESTAVKHVAPCTPVQEGMIYRFLESDQALYFNKFEFRLDDTVDVEKLLAAWNRVIEHLEILRTRFVATDDGFAQVVLRDFEPVSKQIIVDYETMEKSVALRTPYTIAVTDRTLTVRIFHGLYDGNSLNMLLRRVIDEYHGLRSIEYGPSFISSLSRGPLARFHGAESFWKSHVQEWTYQPMPSRSNSTENTVVSSVIENLDSFDTLRKKLGVTPQAVIQAVWISVLQIILSSSLTIGIVVSGRAIDFEGADKVIGPLFNTVPFHVKIESCTTSATLIAKCHDYNMKMQDFQHTPLKDIQKWSPSKPGQALFDTLFVFQRREAEDEDFADGVWTQSDSEQIADVSFLRKMQGITR